MTNYEWLFDDILKPSEYYNKALAAIPKDHSHRDEVISLLIDQVLDDEGYGDTPTN
mgnify:CR=1 FL=1